MIESTDRPVATRMPPDVREEIEEVARAEGVTVAEVVRQLLVAGLVRRRARETSGVAR